MRLVANNALCQPPDLDQRIEVSAGVDEPGRHVVI
jgi:hypothetical protein